MRTQNDVRVTIRVDKDLKNQAEALFERLGMNMTTALNVFLRKAVDEAAIPFPVSAKNALFGAGLTSSDITGAFEDAVYGSIAGSKRNGFPVARYDMVKRQAYWEQSDGTKEYVNG